MILVRNQNDKDFAYADCKNLFDKHSKELRDDNFDGVLSNSQFYSFYIPMTNELLGCIYYFRKDNRTYVNAFASRGHHLINLECFKETLKWFDEDIYAEVTEKTSRLCVLRCGFKRVKGNLFIYRRT